MPMELFARVRGDLHPVELRAGQVLVSQDAPPPAILFPLEGLYSVVKPLMAGETLEVLRFSKACHGATSVLLGSTETEAETITLIGGIALAMSTGKFRKLAQESPEIQAWFQPFAAAIMSHISRAAVCAANHSVSQRLARWLLGASGAIGRARLPITQEMLSLLLAVRRTGVSEELSRMGRAGLVETGRGVITIRDRRGLAAAACECWAEDEAQRERHLQSPMGLAFRDGVDVHGLVAKYQALPRGDVQGD